MFKCAFPDLLGCTFYLLPSLWYGENAHSNVFFVDLICRLRSVIRPLLLSKI
jgi:hypothetical protein